MKEIFRMIMQVQSFVFNPFQENTIILYDETKDCVVIDPGCFEEREKKELETFIDTGELKVQQVLNTHCHVDHVLGNYFVKEKYKTKLRIHPKEEAALKAVKAYASNYGIFQYDEALPDAYMNEGDIIKFGDQELKVIFVPGHAAGHVAFYDEKNKILVGGDVLFYNSIGRTDLPGGNYDQLIESIRKKFFALPDDVTVYPGHGPVTTIGFEKRTNPFCATINVNSKQ